MTKKKKTATKEIASWRHAANCTICRHPQRAEIESLFLEWQSQSKIAKEYRLGSRQTVFRHARAMNLFPERTANTRRTLAAIIERGMTSGMKITADVVVRAVIALSKLDAEGRTVEQFEQVNSNAKFLNDARWTHREMLRYAETGELPSWYDGDEDENSLDTGTGISKPN
jgi:hypothetical protein